MKLILDADPGLQLIRSYEPGMLLIGESRFFSACIVAPQTPPVAWQVGTLASLEAGDLRPLLERQPQILLIGGHLDNSTLLTSLRKKLAQRAVAVEIMDLGAACRTYNILAQEARSVVAGLIPDQPVPPSNGTNDTGPSER